MLRQKRESALKNRRFRHSSGHFNYYNYSLVHALVPIRIDIDRMICPARIILLSRVVLTRRSKVNLWHGPLVSCQCSSATHTYSTHAEISADAVAISPENHVIFYVDSIFSLRSFNLTTHGKLYSLTCSLATVAKNNLKRKNETIKQAIVAASGADVERT